MIPVDGCVSGRGMIRGCNTHRRTVQQYSELRALGSPVSQDSKMTSVVSRAAADQEGRAAACEGCGEGTIPNAPQSINVAFKPQH